MLHAATASRLVRWPGFETITPFGAISKMAIARTQECCGTRLPILSELSPILAQQITPPFRRQLAHQKTRF